MIRLLRRTARLPALPNRIIRWRSAREFLVERHPHLFEPRGQSPFVPGNLPAAGLAPFTGAGISAAGAPPVAGGGDFIEAGGGNPDVND
jgi:hypothetical protein